MVGGANIVATKNGNKEMELAGIDEGQEFEEEQGRVDHGHAQVRAPSNKVRNRVRENGIECNLGVEKVERSEIGGAGSTRSSGEDGLHFGRQGWEERRGDSSSSRSSGGKMF
jgi:hypothetical protein